MSIKQVVHKQYRDIVNSAVSKLEKVTIPPEGWIRTVRKALNMSGAQLARKLGVTRDQVSKAERSELLGSVSLRKMQEMAEAMNCRFVYAVVPKTNIEALIRERAFAKAKEQVKLTSIHMALEEQMLSDENLQFEINRVAQEFIDGSSTSLWND